jgi:hypothetical protein
MYVLEIKKNLNDVECSPFLIIARHGHGLHVHVCLYVHVNLNLT